MIKSLFRDDLKDFKAYKVEEEKYDIKLDANEGYSAGDLIITEEILKDIRECMLNRYPDANCEDIRKLYGEYAEVEPEKIVAGNGSDELIQVLINALAKRGDKILTLSPDFSMYANYSKLLGIQVVNLQLEDEFKIDVDKIIEVINKEKVKIFIFSNPNNPTGMVVPKESILKILEESNSIVVVDEAYYEFYGETMVKYIDEYENLIVLRTCSKALGLAAARLGFLMSNPAVIGEVLKAKSPFNVNSLTQAAGKVVLKNIDKANKNVDEILKEKNYVIEKLSSIKGLKLYKSEANFILVEAENIEKIKSEMIKNSISLRYFGCGRLEDCFRVTIGLKEENMKFLEAIKKACRE